MRIIVPLLALIVSACGAPEAVTTATSPVPSEIETPALTIPMPTSTPQATPRPRTSLDIESLLLESGDLPNRYTGGHVEDESSTPDVPTASRIVRQRFEAAGEDAGGVNVYLFETPEAAQGAYHNMLKASPYTPEASVEMGEQAALTHAANVSQVFFLRCRAVVLGIMHAPATSTLAAYAKRLDKRLQTVVCE